MDTQDADFLETLWNYYAKHARQDLPWRAEPHDPYAIMVSELMLQQTQVSRVIPKFEAFVQRYQTVQQLAAAPLGDVLVSWSGLGYNRRAKFLWQAAQMVVRDHAGILPSDATQLVTLPGIGVNTAGAIMAYAQNAPVVFVETNVRTVYIHHYFAEQDAVTDTAIREQLERTLDREQPREFYWALMDYGTHLKKTVGNLNKQSGSYVKQSTFAGSRRQVRGQILRTLAGAGMSSGELSRSITDERLVSVLNDLVSEKLIQRTGDKYHL